MQNVDGGEDVQAPAATAKPHGVGPDFRPAGNRCCWSPAAADLAADLDFDPVDQTPYQASDVGKGPQWMTGGKCRELVTTAVLCHWHAKSYRWSRC